MKYFVRYGLKRDGYGYGGEKILGELQRLEPGQWKGVDVLRGRGRLWRHSTRWTLGGRTVALCIPEWYPRIDAKRSLIGYTMFESTRMPEGRVETINKHTDGCLVPCEWCAEMFREQGVEVPVRVVRWGVDAEDYYLLDRSDHGQGPYQFLWSGGASLRKGWDLAYRAFWKAFGKRRDAELVMHFRALPNGFGGCTDGNVRIVEGLVGRPALRVMLQEADCFVFPSRGEGWGLPPREAAATGLPAIATNWGGLAEEIEEWGLPLRVKRLTPAVFGLWDAGEVGEWAEPDLEHLVGLMRWCFENREAAAERGRQAAAWTREWGGWGRTGVGVLGMVGW